MWLNDPLRREPADQRKALWHRSLAALVVTAVLLNGCASAPTYLRGSANDSMAYSEAPAAAASEAAMPQEVIVNTVAQEGGALPAPGTASAELARKMIARATLSMVVTDAEQTVEDVEALMEEVGGFISQSNLFNGGTGDAPIMQGSLQLRVPADQLETTLDRLEALAVEVGARTLNREDVTDQYSDVDAQLRNLEATEAELLEMLEEVQERPNATPDDILAVHYRISEVRGQIEGLQGQQNMMDNLIALSTIDLNMVPDASALPVVETGWRPGTVVRAASRALVSTLQTLGNGVIWFVIAVLPVLLMLIFPLVVLIAFVRWLVLRRRGEKGITVRS